MITLVSHNSKVKLPPNNWGEFFFYSAGAFPEPSDPPSSVRTLHIRGNLTGQKLTTGEIQTAGGAASYINISGPPRLFPPTSTRLSGGTLPPETERARERSKAESRDRKYRVARTPLPVRVDFLCQDVGVPPDGSNGPWGNT